tara:strand:- start:1906 stop:2466 length:561 start_codon:yes stop_codon:yes gene_type:complete
MIIAIIPAKGYSNRLPNKNMHPLLGKPLLQYAIDFAQASKKVSNIYISTDDETIIEYAVSQKIEFIKRDAALGGETPLIDVYRHALNTLKIKNISIVVGVQPDHPDRNVLLDDSLEYFESHQLDFMLSTDSDGTKNGAQNIMSAKGIISGEFKRIGQIEDDCTNIHYESDLVMAEERLRSKISIDI